MGAGDVAQRGRADGQSGACTWLRGGCSNGRHRENESRVWACRDEISTGAARSSTKREQQRSKRRMLTSLGTRGTNQRQGTRGGGARHTGRRLHGHDSGKGIISNSGGGRLRGGRWKGGCGTKTPGPCPNVYTGRWGWRRQTTLGALQDSAVRAAARALPWRGARHGGLLGRVEWGGKWWAADWPNVGPAEPGSFRGLGPGNG
jgi:hypothetical protein